MLKQNLCIFLTAIASSASIAQTTSSVTLYGVVDTYLEFVNNISKTPPGAPGFPGSAANRVSLGSGGIAASRWGLRGVEDLGQGNQIVYVLESGFSADDGKSQQGGRLFGRQAYVGMQNGAGKLAFGRQYTSLFELLANFSPTFYANEPAFVMTGLNFRSDNTIKYTGLFGPVTIIAHWSFGNGVGGPGEVPGDARRDTGYGAGVSYLSENLGATLLYDQYNPSLINAGDSGIGRYRKAAVAASYKVGRIKIIAGYRWGENSFSNGTDSLRDNLLWLGANYQATPALVLKFGYYYDNVSRVQLTKASPATTPPHPWQLAFLADYDLSKRTDVYLQVTYSKNAALNFDSASIGFANGYPLASDKNSMFGTIIGIRHRF